jgi:malate dehydrogenase (oxaloacetate-decarboxylating)(NADP+)
LKQLEFGRDYIVPKPLDHRVCRFESHAVARAAIESGAARLRINLDQYGQRLDCLFRE